MIAIQGIAATERALAETPSLSSGSGKAFGKTILDFQNTQFKLAEYRNPRRAVARVFVDHYIKRHLKEIDRRRTYRLDGQVLGH